MPSLCSVQNCTEIIEYHKLICTCIKEAENKFISTKRIKSSEYTDAGMKLLVKHSCNG